LCAQCSLLDTHNENNFISVKQLEKYTKCTYYNALTLQILATALQTIVALMPELMQKHFVTVANISIFGTQNLKCMPDFIFLACA